MHIPALGTARAVSFKVSQSCQLNVQASTLCRLCSTSKPTDVRHTATGQSKEWSRRAFQAGWCFRSGNIWPRPEARPALSRPRITAVGYTIAVGAALERAVSEAAQMSDTPKNSACRATTAPGAWSAATINEMFVLEAPWLIIRTLHSRSRSTPNTCVPTYPSDASRSASRTCQPVGRRV